MQQILLSGAVGSAKSLLMAHVIVIHCLANRGASVGIGRLTMPSLKDTLLQLILTHISDEVEIVHNQVRGSITFPNGSTIKSFSWKDKNYKKVRSTEFSLFAIEELTENHTREFYDEILMRTGRLRHVKEKLVISATNPDDPSHWAYKHFIATNNPNIHVYYSKTTDNKFLPDSYVTELQENLDPKMARRMIHGEWLSIQGDVVYYNYERERNFKDEDYTIKHGFPIYISFDFNIGEGKPFSVVLYQYIHGVFHCFDEVVIQGSRTEDALEDMASRGLLDHRCQYIVHGDATGKNRTTSSTRSDYDIIDKFMSNYNNKQGRALNYKREVPAANPAVRKRHNLVNAQMQNAVGQVKLYVYKNCKTLDEGLRLTKLKPGGNYIEDDSKHYQHITTSLGYGLCYDLAKEKHGNTFRDSSRWGTWQF